ncbi:MAG: hypothetical protein ACFE85_10355 [Candidatus Hodarchaeota archaeon]
MKLKLVLTTETQNNKTNIIKFNVSPSKHLGLVNLIKLALNQKNQVNLSFEKISRSGEREESKISGSFKLDCGNSLALKQLEEEIKERERKRKKRHQKRKHK